MSLEDTNSNSKKGYLDSDFRFFHLKDKRNMDFEYHYHEFYKIIIFISGKVTYLIEGRTYEFRPYDIVFVNKNDIHKSEISASEMYERIILWMSDDFLDKQSSALSSLKYCFNITSENKSKLMRLNKFDLESIKNLLTNLETASTSGDMGSEILAKALFLQLLVYLNRYSSDKDNFNIQSGISHDEAIDFIIDYINTNLSDDLSLDTISAKFYMSKYNLMHKFKKQTGYSLHSYIVKKRLILAKSLIKKGSSVGDACLLCGFGDYANFIRAYKKMYGVSPKRDNSSI